MPMVTEAGAIKPGVRRDLSDQLLYVDMKKTPFKSAIKKGKRPTAKLVEWPADDYEDVNTEGVMSGKDVTEFEGAFDGYGLLSTYIQKFRRTAKVDDVDEETSNVAGIGIKQLFGKAIAKKMKAIVRDKEAAFLSDNNAQAQANGNPWMTRGMMQWAEDNATGVCPIPEQYRTRAGARFTAGLSTLTEKKFSQMMQAVYDETGEPDDFTGYCGTELIAHMSEWAIYTPNVTDTTVVRRHNGDSKTLSRKVPIIDTNWGTLKAMPSSFINLGGNPKSAESKRLGIFGDMAKIEEREVKKGGFKRLEDAGGGPRGYIDCITALAVMNPVGLLQVKPSGA